MRCKNTYCKYNVGKGKCSVSKEVVIGDKGICTRYEHGFQYYFFKAVDMMDTNFILTYELDYEARCSIYYLMTCLPIKFAEDSIRGFLVLRNSKTHDIIDKKTLLSMIETELDHDKFIECYIEFAKNGLPHPECNPNIPEYKGPENVEYKEYGWLSPRGKFYEADFGDHEMEARNIILKNGLNEEFREWSNDDYSKMYKDYLSSIKGYALIHDPIGLHGYIVSHTKPLTKYQREFLYDYFSDMNMKSRAKEFLED